MPALCHRVRNDVSAELSYAQAASGYGSRDDVLLGISTSGNAANVRAALVVAAGARDEHDRPHRASGGARWRACATSSIAVPATRTFEVQELHLPVYHCLCAMVEDASSSA